MAQVKDPVCGMMIDSNEAAAQSQFQGQTYYFCSAEEKREFDENPGKFVGATAGTRPEQRPGA
jgi:YHS domain-containing protein